MPRKGPVPKREVMLDPKYIDKGPEMRRTITRFINTVMVNGKRSTAEQIVYGAFEEASRQMGEEPIKIFEKALANVKPKVEVKSRRVGGATYQVPVDVRPERAASLGMRWLVGYARERSEKTMLERLAQELKSAAEGKGNAVKKREDTHKMAEANRAFANYRW